MKKVYIVSINNNIIGCYSTKEKAIERTRRINRGLLACGSFDRCVTKEINIDE